MFLHFLIILVLFILATSKNTSKYYLFERFIKINVTINRINEDGTDRQLSSNFA